MLLSPHLPSEPCSSWVFTDKNKTKETKAKPTWKGKRGALAVEQSNRKEGRLSVHCLWINISTHMHTNIHLYTAVCGVASKLLFTLCFATLHSNLQIRLIMGQASGKRSTGSVQLRQTRSEYRCDSTGSAERIMSPFFAGSFQKRTADCSLISYTDYCERFDLDLLPRCQHVLQCISTVC